MVMTALAVGGSTSEAHSRAARENWLGKGSTDESCLTHTSRLSKKDRTSKSGEQF